jgi:hypothetical protein
MRRQFVLAAAASSVVLLSASPAFAAWSANGKGTAVAKGGALGGTSITTPLTCGPGNGQRIVVTLHWAAVAGATSYNITGTGAATSGTASTTTYSDSSANQIAANSTFTYTVVATAGNNWIGPASATASYTNSAKSAC